MPILFYDTETTGLPDRKAPSDSPGQPHLVQIAAVLVDPETLEVLGRMNRIVAPDDWTISKEVSAIHGITHERALDQVFSEPTDPRDLRLVARVEVSIGPEDV